MQLRSHVSTGDLSGRLVSLIGCILMHRNSGPCERCEGLWECRACRMQCEVRVSSLGAAGHLLELNVWKNLSSGRHPDDPEWRQHVLPASEKCNENYHFPSFVVHHSFRYVGPPSQFSSARRWLRRPLPSHYITNRKERPELRWL